VAAAAESRYRISAVGLIVPCCALQARDFDPMRFDPSRLVFETVASNYGSLYNVMQDKDGFLWLAGLNGAMIETLHEKTEMVD